MSDLSAFKEDLKKVLDKYKYSRREMDKYGGSDNFIGVDVYPVFGGELCCKQNLREIVEEVFGNIGYKSYE